MKRVAILIAVLMLLGCAGAIPYGYKCFADRFPELSGKYFVPALGDYMLINPDDGKTLAMYGINLAEAEHPENGNWIFWIDLSTDGNLDGRADGMWLLVKVPPAYVPTVGEYQTRWFYENQIPQVEKEVEASGAKVTKASRLKLPRNWEKVIEESRKKLDSSL